MSIASEIQQKVLAQTGVWIRIGISSNKMLAKTATDIWAKKMTVAFSCCLHPILQRCCGLSQYVLCSASVRAWNGIWRSLDYTIGDIARTPLPRLQDRFRSHFGKQSDIQAEVIWRTANGIDHSPVKPETFNTPPKSIGHMMTLPRDYLQPAEVETILLELTEEVCRDARRKGYMGSVVTVHCICSPYEAPTGFSRQMKIPDPTNHTQRYMKPLKKSFILFGIICP